MEKRTQNSKGDEDNETIFARTSALMAVQKLKQLKTLLNQGLITEAQYQAESQKLLNQIVE